MVLIELGREAGFCVIDPEPPETAIEFANARPCPTDTPAFFQLQRRALTPPTYPGNPAGRRQPRLQIGDAGPSTPLGSLRSPSSTDNMHAKASAV
jgi:hypothetical protein